MKLEKYLFQFFYKKHAFSGKIPGPVGRSNNNHIKLSFKEGIENDFLNILNEAILNKSWENLPSSSTSDSKV